MEGQQLTIRMKTHWGKIVDFAISQSTLVGSKWVNVARIDCCWGTIHRHLYDKAGEPLEDHVPICDIPLGEAGYDVVNARYDDCLAEMETTWEDNLRRWNGDTP
jgi:hypothetical protein